MGADSKLGKREVKKEFTCSKCGKRSATIVEMCHAFRRLREQDHARIYKLERVVKKLQKKVRRLQQESSMGTEEWNLD